jgi:MFS family permease
MGIYAFFLAGSNYFAPVICGFIATDMNWKWVFYFPAMFLGFALVFCFLFLEETNYKRATVGVVEIVSGTQTPITSEATDEKGAKETAPVKEPEFTSVEKGTVTYGSTKTFTQKLSLWQPSPGQNMFARALMSLKYLSWPVVFYAGFSYGSYLVSLPSPLFPFVPS